MFSHISYYWFFFNSLHSKSKEQALFLALHTSSPNHLLCLRPVPPHSFYLKQQLGWIMLHWHIIDKKEKDFLLSTVDILICPWRVICMPFWESMTKAFASFWKTNVHGICKFQAVTFIYTLEIRVLKEKFPWKAGKKYMTCCLYFNDTISETCNLFLWTESSRRLYVISQTIIYNELDE